jgi:hypothetical protein
MGNSVSSIQRAVALLDHSCDYEDFLIIKLEPEPRSCCCFHCWPETWLAINQFIAPYGSIKDEGALLIKKDDYELVLECHESGPEIIVYLGLAVVSLDLIKSVVELITIFVKTLQKEHRKTPARIKIVSRRIIKGSDKDEILMELDIPLSDDVTDTLNSEVRKALRKNINKSL